MGNYTHYMQKLKFVYYGTHCYMQLVKQTASEMMPVSNEQHETSLKSTLKTLAMRTLCRKALAINICSCQRCGTLVVQ